MGQYVDCFVDFKTASEKGQKYCVFSLNLVYIRNSLGKLKSLRASREHSNEEWKMTLVSSSTTTRLIALADVSAFINVKY
jgi:hypothetical protein